MSESTLSLPFNKAKQLAFLGYCIYDDKLFLEVKDRVKSTWFNEDSGAQIIYQGKIDFFQKHMRCATPAELKNWGPFLASEPLVRNRISESFALSEMHMHQFGLDALRNELTTWLRSELFIGAMKTANKEFQGTNQDKAFEIMKAAMRDIETITFMEDHEERFENFVDDLSKNEIESKDALTFGLKGFDRLLKKDPDSPGGSLLLGDTSIALGPVNVGKCLGKNTPVIMADGSIKMIQDIKIGEQVMGPDGKPRNVLSTTTGRSKLYKIIPKSGGESWVCNDSHVLSLKYGFTRSKVNGEKIVNIPINEYLKTSNNFKYETRLWRASLNFEEKKLPIDPYVFGLWLGDGNSHNARITSMDSEIIETWKTWLITNGDSYKIYTKLNTKAIIVAGTGTDGTYNARVNSNKKIKELGVKDNKHIPLEYLTSSREQRLALLAGIIDTDGSYNNDCYEISTKIERLANEISYLASSLGFKVTKNKTRKTIKSINFEGEYYRLHIRGKLSEIPVKLERKRAKDNCRRSDISGFDIEDIGVGDYYGFSLDGDHLFLLGDFTVTHNSTHLITIIVANLKLEKYVLWITHEGRPEDLKEKLLCCYLDISTAELYSMYKHERGREILSVATQQIGKYLTYIPMNEAGLTVETVVSRIRRRQEQLMFKRGNGRGFDMVVDDYPATLMTSGVSASAPKREKDMHIYYYFTQLALEYKFHSLLAIQANREGAKINKGIGDDRLLTKEDVAESYGPMHKATNVWTINRDPVAQANNRVTFYIDKSRSNETGFAVVCRSNYGHARTHDEKLGYTWYRGTSSYTDKIDALMSQYSGGRIEDRLLLGV